MKNKFRTGISACFISFSMLLCGCDSTQIQETDTSITSESSVTAVSIISGELLLPEGGDNVSDYPVIINDTEIEKTPEKVICLSSSLTEIIYELGFGAKLNGRGSYCDFPESVVSLRDFGKPSSPDLDAVRAAKPDLLVTATSIPNKDIAALSDEGIKVLYIASPRSVEEYGRIYCALGMVFEGMHEGEKTGNAIFGKIRDKLENADISLGKFIYITEGNAVAGGDTFESSVLSLYGDNIAKEAFGYNF
ncbi:MAG: ABC transporter substrate-binding protein, partial [Ruminiclostridium sp.]|nr:ABC transporter substrate-binding protein [Ruminiclostridium sp.]